MQLTSFPFQTLDWSSVPKEIKKGATGIAFWQVFMMNDIRIRKVEYSADYLADHWCSKGHIIFCLEGSMETELLDGRKFILSAGMTYHVGDHNEPHRSSTIDGCKLFIVD
ncbi:MAG: DHCW motif cupin fold protein [Ferruginibacter sp.]